MCGIVGYIGDKQAAPFLMEGLRKLEYRGYDSAGIAVFDGEKLDIRKKKGRLSVLGAAIKGCEPVGTLGIGHTRWATHGEAADNNAHPQFNAARDIAIVHNGIIENYVRLREWLKEKGYTFVSETDTEVIVHLIDYNYKGNLFEAVQNAVSRLTGAYALCVVSSREPDEIIVVRKGSPLVIGAGEGENFVASDIPALLAHTRRVYLLNDGEMARITKASVEITDSYGMPIKKDIFNVEWDIKAADKEGYPYFMLKEICEQPRVIRDVMSARLGGDGRLDLQQIGLTEDMIRATGRIVIVACGTAYHAGLSGKYMLEKNVRIPVEVDFASEFRYRNPIINKDDLVIIISQSGETADSLEALRLAKDRGAKVMGICNAVGSTISREADSVMYTEGGPEIAVASTKAYIGQVMCLMLLTAEFGRVRGTLDDEGYTKIMEGLYRLPECAEEALKDDDAAAKLAHMYCPAHDIYFFGRNIDYPVSLEGSLKLKEISYIHSEAFAAGELKHGPIALIEKGTLVVAIATQPELFEKLASNIKEVKARGAYVLAVCPADAHAITEAADCTFTVPDILPELQSMLAILPLQLFAYHCAIERGLDPDFPRNLAKSVTVE